MHQSAGQRPAFIGFDERRPQVVLRVDRDGDGVRVSTADRPQHEVAGAVLVAGALVRPLVDIALATAGQGGATRTKPRQQQQHGHAGFSFDHHGLLERGPAPWESVTEPTEMMPGDEAAHDFTFTSILDVVEERADPAFHRGEVLVAIGQHRVRDQARA